MASAASAMPGALRSFALAWTGDVAIAVVPRDKADVVFTVVHGRLGLLVQPSDSDVDKRDPEPDFPSNGVSASCCSAEKH